MSREGGPHPVEGLVLHLLPGRLPGLTQRELLRKIERILYRWPDLSMQEVRPVVLSALLASLERRKLIEGNGEGAQRCYWRVAPPPAASSRAAQRDELYGQRLLAGADHRHALW
jgi:hypothetical protein